MPRFFVETTLSPGTEVDLPKAVAHHATRVLRLRDGAEVALFNGYGGEYHGRLSARGSKVVVSLEQHFAVERESPLPITLVQAWVAADKLDWVVEKAVELGVARLVIVPAARSVVRPDQARSARRAQRLHDILIAACCQSGRNTVPGVEVAPTLQNGLRSALSSGSIGLLLDPQAPTTLIDAARGAIALALVVGPEGGLDDAERGLAASLGYRAVTLGPRILRTETAGLAALAALQAAAGDLG
ncbi:MAG TPA: 16S rRNA (uracil(1498)-N(3))-methyltransferase [Burkholderiaceae bacterium]|nr:16S rRNA (uracil(1498)-N(3))-methyltransferase [Burkholderiaceae bacterium]